MRYDLIDSQYPMEPDPAFRRRAAWLLAKVGEHQVGSAEVLDIGCGRGFYLPLYQQLGALATGLEADAGLLPFAREAAARSNGEVHHGNAESLPFPDSSFDIVVLSEVLEHLVSPKEALAEAARVLRGGGLLLVTVPHANYPFWWDPINKVREHLGLSPVRKGLFAGIWANHHRLYTADALIAELTAAGLTMRELVRQTRHCMPFVHNLVYGLGRTWLETGRMPAGWIDGGMRGGIARDRKAVAKAGILNPVALGVGLAQWFDEGNADAEPPNASAVNLCVAAVKPQERVPTSGLAFAGRR